MENKKSNENVVKNEDKKTTDASIFTKEEIDSTVRQFLLGWIKGDVKINFATADHFVAKAKREGKHLNYEDASKREETDKLAFLNLISIIAEKTPATSEEKKTAISEMFTYILAFRCGNRISGTFGKQEEYEMRLARTEEQIAAMNESIQLNNLVQEFAKYKMNCPECSFSMGSYRNGDYIVQICWNCGHYESDSPAYHLNPSLFKNMVRDNPQQYMCLFLKMKPADEILQRKRNAKDFTEPELTALDAQDSSGREEANSL